MPEGWSSFSTALYQMLPDSLIPVMTSNTDPVGTGSVISNNSATTAWYAFNRTQVNGNYWQSNTNNTGWLGFYFNSGKTVKRYSFKINSNTLYAPYSWTFEGSNDGVTWSILDTITTLSIPSSTIYISSILSNTTSYTRYRINVSITFGAVTPIIEELEMTESSNSPYCTTTSFITDGVLVLPSGYTINATTDIQGYRVAAGSFITYAGSGTSTINTGAIYGGGGASTYGLNHSGTGTLNINGNISAYLFNYGSGLGSVTVSGLGTLNVVGNITTTNSNNNCHGLFITSSCTVNVTGNIIYQTGTSTRAGIWINSGSPTITITGSLYGISPASLGNCPIYIASGSPTINVIGNIDATLTTAIYNPSTSVIAVNVTGNLIASGSTACINGYAVVNHTGLISSSGYCVVYSVSNSSSSVTTNATSLTNAVNGAMLFVTWKLFFTGSTGRTWTFRKEDGTTPVVLYSSDQITSSGQPYPADVRLGTTYGAGVYTGTCAVPSPLNVAYGVDVDNVKGLAVITGDAAGAAVWDRLTSLMVTSGSIGERLKNAATVQTTGSQISAFDI